MTGHSKHKDVLLECIRFLFIFLFLYAAISKFLVFDEFKIQIEQAFIPIAYTNLVAWMVPLIEILISLLLMISLFKTLALYTALGLMEVFTLYIFIILRFSDHIPFSYNRVLLKLGWIELLVFNITFMTLAVIGIMILSMPKNLQP
ncbi:MauE/DoxX family redox-associated membrane protein [Flavivirga aquimarina]|uniref:MauE/DoxX family redox-associated membrane protein n=1 Tax=Flavivirga aquimarina TaxID=2027862 RepID=A0ABT8W694_9FLAO|nr:MauE/DoxX family redox-associated membrane protein [Flavivirga aquimarina]MDO5968638.1 MauE/DoxX family redox-associated membrane protein [Flavivirga aquimarina]